MLFRSINTLFNAANPLPDRVVLGENQIFIVKKSTVYEVDSFHLNLLQTRSASTNRIEDISLTATNAGQFETFENWIVVPAEDKVERYETGDVVIADRYGSAVTRITLEYRHMDEVEPRTKLEDSSVRTTPMVVSGGNFTVALMSDGTVWAWGDNTYSQLGAGVDGVNMPYANQPMQVRSHMGNGSEYGDYLKDIVKVAAGKNHAMALDRNGNVYAWGDSSNRQLSEIGRAHV